MNPKALNDLFDNLNIISFKINDFFGLYSFTVSGDDEYLRLVYDISHEIFEYTYKRKVIQFTTINKNKGMKTIFAEDIQRNEELHFQEVERIIVDFFSKHATFIRHGLKGYSGYTFNK